MKFFIGRIDPSLTKKDFKDYFDNYGTVTEIKMFERDRYGFVTFDEPFNSDQLLASKEHSIGDKAFIVEKSKEQNRNVPRADGYDRYERDSYDYSRDCPRDGSRDGSRDGYGRDRFRRDAYDGDRFGRDYGRDYERDRYAREPPRRRCDYCDRCPVHGVQQPPREKGHSNGHLKIVCEKLGSDVQTRNLESFAVENGFTPTFAKMIGDCGFLEFQNISEKDAALKKLDGACLMLRSDNGEVTRSYTVETRSYVPQDQFNKDRTFKKRRTNERAPQAMGGEDPRIDEVYNDSNDAVAEEQHEHL